ncbi:alkyl/aryl-sulfatase [Maricaulis virginensis]|uniref:Beta-lactamase-like protein n=1 Tax=Maricaulis virginensis TaxID=144022 RepID=A0A9W6IMW1_9PROT|nr:alkyl sulfatase dimerization domain-containing protein [Maricaulis virginensis]GLK51861.1 beta-lactamase-like protein [Maricaulis virginensis]
MVCQRMTIAALAALLAVTACSGPSPQQPVEISTDEADTDGAFPATGVTGRLNAQIARDPALIDDEDWALVQRGFVARDADLDIRDADGRPIWRPADYDFLDGEDAPDTVHPSLWRQARLNAEHGLYEVVPGIYQVRGYDLANMSIVEGETGRIIIDPLTSVETAQAALALVERELGPRPVSAVVLTHSHIDHFGGVEAIEGALGDGPVPVIAPAGFLEEAVSENVMAGVVMARRAGYMYGTHLPRTARGHVGSGLGKHPALGRHTIAEPDIIVDHTGQVLEIDGVRMEFQYAPDTEAPAELTVFFPDFGAWCGAELVSRNLHNLYTLRGAQVRDALAWSAGIEEARRVFGGRAEVAFNSHHWPVWGADEVDDFLVAQRDIYKYIHDQTLRLAARGLGPDEIAETIVLPDALAGRFAVRGYYGTLRHNSRAVYQRYFGWYDGVPANLDPLPRGEAAHRYVDLLGGVEAAVAAAETAFADGDYRWSAELAQHAVYAAPGNEAAAAILARSYEQLGYRAESAPWRDVYLSAARELRHGVPETDAVRASEGILDAIPLDMFFAAMATRIDGPRAARNDRVFNFVFTDVGETHVIELSNGVMHHHRGEPRPDADATVELTRTFWMRLLQQEAGLVDMLASQEFAIRGDRRALLGFFALLEQPDPDFPVVTGRPDAR